MLLTRYCSPALMILINERFLKNKTDNEFNGYLITSYKSSPYKQYKYETTSLLPFVNFSLGFHFDVLYFQNWSSRQSFDIVRRI